MGHVQWTNMNKHQQTSTKHHQTTPSITFHLKLWHGLVAPCQAFLVAGQESQEAFQVVQLAVPLSGIDMLKCVENVVKLGPFLAATQIPKQLKLPLWLKSFYLCLGFKIGFSASELHPRYHQPALSRQCLATFPSSPSVAFRGTLKLEMTSNDQGKPVLHHVCTLCTLNFK